MRRVEEMGMREGSSTDPRLVASSFSHEMNISAQAGDSGPGRAEWKANQAAKR